MFGSAAGKQARLARQQPVAHRRTLKFTRKIWLPKLYYDALPWFYLSAGVSALLATLYINAWFWVLPHYLLFTAACFHLAIYVFRSRRGARRRSEQKQPPAT
ncbi:MAG: hypothetical protein AAFX56_07715 [Pseudomonadota bacterium]